MRRALVPRRFLGDSTITTQPPPNAIPYNSGGNLVQGRGLFFSYNTPAIASLANGATSTVTIQFDNNSIFTWLRACVRADIAGAVQTPSSMVIPLVTLQITDTGTGMSFMNGPTAVEAIAGTGQLPYVLPTPQLIQPNASLQFAFSNYSSATTYANLQFILQGFRTFQ